MAKTLQHESHDHALEILRAMEINVGKANCRACGLSFKPEVDLFGCRNCGFFLHRPCGLKRPSLEHPFHPEHQLELRYTSAYKKDTFYCDICGHGEKGFNYHCKSCNFGAHMTCVDLPLKAKRRNHKKHPLELLFRAPEGTSCRHCHKEIKHCCYSCSDCIFNTIFVHVECSDIPREGISPEEALRHAAFGAGLAITMLKSSVGLHFLPDTNFGDFLPDTNFGDFDFGDFGDLPGLEGYADVALQAEASSLAFEHMASMGM